MEASKEFEVGAYMDAAETHLINLMADDDTREVRYHVNKVYGFLDCLRIFLSEDEYHEIKDRYSDFFVLEFYERNEMIELEDWISMDECRDKRKG